MRWLKTAAALAFAAVLSGCAGSFATDYDKGVEADVSRAWRVADIVVVAPASLTTTEENSLAPNADIVWHGEPRGDRRLQAARIVEDGLRAGSAALNGRTPVRLQAQLNHFHGITPVALNQAPAAVHNISYILQVVSLSTGDTLFGPETIQADLPALTQSAAAVAAANGISERQRIVDHIAETTAGWLGIGPDPRGTFNSLGR
jgi:hypothetical protein